MKTGWKTGDLDGCLVLMGLLDPPLFRTDDGAARSDQRKGHWDPGGDERPTRDSSISDTGSVELAGESAAILSRGEPWTLTSGCGEEDSCSELGTLEEELVPAAGRCAATSGSASTRDDQ